MTMIAIKLCEENFDKILPTVSSRLPAADLQAMVEEYGQRSEPLFFVPAINRTAPSGIDDWGTIPLKYLSENFTYDIDLIGHQFVEIIPVRD